MKKNIKKLAEDLEAIINSEIRKTQSDDTKYKNHYNNVMAELENRIKDTETFKQHLTEQNLSFNAIEAEGYLRALKDMVEEFKSWEKYI